MDSDDHRCSYKPSWDSEDIQRSSLTKCATNVIDIVGGDVEKRRPTIAISTDLYNAFEERAFKSGGDVVHTISESLAS